MNYRKTWFGWINFFIGTGFMSVFLFALLASMLKNTGLTLSFLNFDEKITSVILAVLGVLVAYGMFFLMYFVKKNISIVPNKGTKIVKNIFYSLFVIALAVLLVMLSMNYLEGVYFEHTKAELSKEALPLVNALFGGESVSSNDYCLLAYSYVVSFTYRLFGNSVFFAACLDVIIKCCIAVFLFVSASLLFGKMQGLFGFGFLLLFCDISKPSAVLNEEPLILFVSAFFFMVFSMVLRDRNDGEMKSFGNIVFFIFFGLVFGALAFLNVKNVYGFVLFFFVLLLSKAKKEEKRIINHAALPTIFFVLFFAAGFVGMMFLLECNMDINSIIPALTDYLKLFGFTPDFSFAYPSYYPAECVVIAVFCLFSFLSFTISDKKDRVTVCSFGFLLLYVSYSFKLVDTELAHLLYFFFGLMMGSGVKEFLFEGYDKCREEVIKPVVFGEVETVSEPVSFTEPEMVSEPFAPAEPVFVPETVFVSEPEPVPAPVPEPALIKEEPVVELIENPLPLPKKHVKKTFDFAVEPDPEFMEFDYEISEGDDFDI